ncbi:M15 family metallopeptidase [Hymenobacter profundi]|uniref:M15 family metallopeptidase n=1 Tax=Hymenobacter profundi TaxID=1982110 RepID=A0ABS6WW41_9BACT|nr:M15 family metallopeptidase [Hymenobacter profundi]MBW3127286.1 M15 family metallopeptidase [Hymenobacter profundi]
MEEAAVYTVRGRVAPRLTVEQKIRQAKRLLNVCPELVDAYQVALRRWSGDPALRLLGLPIVTEGHRSAEEQDKLYARGRSAPGPIVTYKRGGESKHNSLPSRALDVAFLLADGSVVWSGVLLSKFARLMKAADVRVRWGGDWPGFKDRPHFEV